MTKTFGPLKAVNDLSFNIQKWEIVVFLGPNGAGKTTSIRLITGIFPLVGMGSIKLFDQNISDEPEKYKNQIKSLSVENEQLSKSLLESKKLSQCKRVLMQKNFTEEEAHKYILKYAMDNHIDKIEACNRLLKSNSD